MCQEKNLKCIFLNAIKYNVNLESYRKSPGQDGRGKPIRQASCPEIAEAIKLVMKTYL